MKFTQELRQAVLSYNAKIEEANKVVQSVAQDASIKGSQLAKERQAEAEAKVQELTEEALKTFEEIRAKFGVVMADKYRPNGDDLTSDAQLFNTPIELSLEELKELLDKYKDNNTMLRLIADYDKKHSSKLLNETAFIYYSKEDKLIKADQLVNYAKSALNYPDFNSFFIDEAKYNKLLVGALENE